MSISPLQILNNFIETQANDYLKSLNLDHTQFHYMNVICSVVPVFLKFLNGLIDKQHLSPADCLKSVSLHGFLANICEIAAVLKACATALNTNHFAFTFHGTKTADNALDILKNGFNPSKRTAQQYGTGEYHSDSFATAAYYGKWVILCLSIHHSQAATNILLSPNPTCYTTTYLLPLAVTFCSSTRATPILPNNTKNKLAPFPIAGNNVLSHFASVAAKTVQSLASQLLKPKASNNTTTTSSSLSSPSSTSTIPQQSYPHITWCVDDGKGGFNNFNAKARDDVEHKYQQYLQNPLLAQVTYNSANVDGYVYTYAVDFSKMQQQNTNTNVKRVIKRIDNNNLNNNPTQQQQQFQSNNTTNSSTSMNTTQSSINNQKSSSTTTTTTTNTSNTSNIPLYEVCGPNGTWHQLSPILSQTIHTAAKNFYSGVPNSSNEVCYTFQPPGGSLYLYRLNLHTFIQLNTHTNVSRQVRPVDTNHIALVVSTDNGAFPLQCQTTTNNFMQYYFNTPKPNPFLFTYNLTVADGGNWNYELTMITQNHNLFLPPFFEQRNLKTNARRMVRLQFK